MSWILIRAPVCNGSASASAALDGCSCGLHWADLLRDALPGFGLGVLEVVCLLQVEPRRRIATE